MSIDIDIIYSPGTKIEEYLQAYKDYGFIDYKPVERIQRGTEIPKTHSKFFYQVAFIDGIDRIEKFYWMYLTKIATISLFTNFMSQFRIGVYTFFVVRLANIY